MEFNEAVLTAILTFAAGLSLLMQTPFAKALIKAWAKKLYFGSFSQRFIPDNMDADTFSKKCVVFAVWALAVGIVVASQNIDMKVIVYNMSDEWRWLANVKTISVTGLANITLSEYSLEWYLDKAALTVLVSLSSQTIYAIGKALKEIIPLIALLLKAKVDQLPE